MGVGSAVAPREDEPMSALTNAVYACYLADNGDNTELVGDSLADISEALEDAGYAGPEVEVSRANGNVVGFASSTEFRYAN